MCNAWNHPIGCRCGWGGDGYLGAAAVRGAGSALRSFSDWAKTRYANEAKSYTNPNATCPVCNAPVFFYQSPEGGRVFFDEMGPPWPKHPCTDTLNEKERFRENRRASLAGSHRSVSRQSEAGWTPFICESVVAVPPRGGAVSVKGLTSEGELTLFVKEEYLKARAPYVMRQVALGMYELSTVQFDEMELKGYTVRGYKNIKDVLLLGRTFFDKKSESDKTEPPKSQNLSQAINATEKVPAAGKNKLQGGVSRRERPIRSDKKGKTAMQLAFEKMFGVDFD